MVRDLTLEDCKGLKVEGNSPMDYLYAVAGKALEIYDKSERACTLRAKSLTAALHFASSSTEPTTARQHFQSPSTLGRTSRLQQGCLKVNKLAKTASMHFPLDTTSRLQQAQEEPPRLPQEFTNAIQEIAGGRNWSQLKMVMEKKLSESDIRPSLNRLLMPLKQIRDDFLTEDEKDYISGKDEYGSKRKMEVTVIEPLLGREDVKFGKWDMNKALNYGMNETWKNIVQRNHLRAGMLLQVWSFRIQQNLHFAIVKDH